MEFRPHHNSAFTFLAQKRNNENEILLRDDESLDKNYGSLNSRFSSMIQYQELIYHKSLQLSFLQPSGHELHAKNFKYAVCDKSNSSDIQCLKDEEKKRKLPYNDTKNIPKNFGKAIIAFAQKNPVPISRCLKKYEINYTDFITELRKKKRTLHSIKQLRAMWLDSQFPLAQPFREISLYFMNHSSLKYIFGSRVIDYSGHLKYRKRIIKALRNPMDFYSIKHQ